MAAEKWASFSTQEPMEIEELSQAAFGDQDIHIDVDEVPQGGIEDHFQDLSLEDIHMDVDEAMMCPAGPSTSVSSSTHSISMVTPSSVLPVGMNTIPLQDQRGTAAERKCCGQQGAQPHQPPPPPPPPPPKKYKTTKYK